MASDLIQSLTSFDPSQCSDEAQRLELITVAKSLLAKIRTRTEFMSDIVAQVPVLNSVIRILLDKDVFEIWQKNGEGPKTVQELAALVDMDPVLLRRLLLYLVSHHCLDQVDENTFAFNRLTAGFAEPAGHSWSAFFYDLTFPILHGLPSYFRKFGYSSPRDPSNSAFAIALGQPGKNLFEILASRPEFGAHFNRCMTEYGRFRTHWLDIYPSESLIDGSEKPILVDIAGGVGHDLDRFSRKHAGHSDRLVLAERPEVAARAICDPKVKKIDHDFFTPMPVQGARAYYMKEILHDWPDDHVIKILENIKPAMTPGYSRILVNDIVMPRIKPDTNETMLDIMMMGMLGALERTEDQWRDVVSAAGLKLVKIWSSPTAVESIIEIELISS